MQQHVTAGSIRSVCTRRQAAAQSFHPQIIRHQQAIKPDSLANDALNKLWRQGSRDARIDGVVSDMGGHRHRGVRKARERVKILGEFILASRDARQLQMTVGH